MRLNLVAGAALLIAGCGNAARFWGNPASYFATAPRAVDHTATGSVGAPQTASAVGQAPSSTIAASAMAMTDAARPGSSRPAPASIEPRGRPSAVSNPSSFLGRDESALNVLDISDQPIWR